MWPSLNVGKVERETSWPQHCGWRRSHPWEEGGAFATVPTQSTCQGLQGEAPGAVMELAGWMMKLQVPLILDQPSWLVGIVFMRYAIAYLS